MSWDIPIGGTTLPQAQRPLLPGGPSAPPHPLGRRVVYLVVGVIVGLTGGLGNALVTANLAQLQGSLGLYAAEINWPPTVYTMTYVISPQVSGHVTAVAVQDYQWIAAGQVLARIDDRIYQRKVEQAQAVLDAQIAAARP